MNVQIVKGLQIVARGKVALVIGAVDSLSLEVLLLSTRQRIVVGLHEIEFIKNVEQENVASDLLFIAKLESEATEIEIDLATTRHNVISKLMQKEITVAQAASRLGISPQHVYRLLGKHNDDVGYCAQLVQRRGNKKGSRHLDLVVEKAIENTINKFKRKVGVTLAEMRRHLEAACISLGVECPSRKTLRSRINASLTSKEVTRMRYGREVAAQTHDARPGEHKVSKPLEWVQSDHTLVDIEVLSDDRKEIIGRPWLTLFIDVYSRVILGYYLSLHAPSTLSVACALTHAVMRKDEFLRRLNLSEFNYPIFGPPSTIHMDNAKEYTSAKYLSSLDRARISYAHRPRGKKHYGGHVERLIGTMMNKVHLLSGSTMSNTVARKRMANSRAPTQTFSEFARWFALEVIEYHSTVHSGIKKSPLQAWEEYYGPHGVSPFPPQVSDAHQFRLNFMPEEYRSIRPAGVEFKTRLYWDPVLEPFVGEKKVLLKYDPFSLKQIWIRLEGQFIPIPFADMTLPDISYEEHRASLFYSNTVEPGSFADSQGAEAYNAAQQIEEASIKLTRAAKKQFAAQAEYQKQYPPAIEVQEVSNVKPDYTSPPKPFKGGV